MKNFYLTLAFMALYAIGFGQSGTDPIDQQEPSLEVYTTVSGMGDRGIQEIGEVYLDDIDDADEGIVVIRICVDANGQVALAQFTQDGSTSSDDRLIAAAVNSARQFRFDRFLVDNHCGRITYNFKLE